MACGLARKNWQCAQSLERCGWNDEKWLKLLPWLFLQRRSESGGILPKLWKKFVPAYSLLWIIKTIGVPMSLYFLTQNLRHHERSYMPKWRNQQDLGLISQQRKPEPFQEKKRTSCGMLGYWVHQHQSNYCTLWFFISVFISVWELPRNTVTYNLGQVLNWYWWLTRMVQNTSNIPKISQKIEGTVSNAPGWNPNPQDSTLEPTILLDIPFNFIRLI